MLFQSFFFIYRRRCNIFVKSKWFFALKFHPIYPKEKIERRKRTGTRGFSFFFTNRLLNPHFLPFSLGASTVYPGKECGWNEHRFSSSQPGSISVRESATHRLLPERRKERNAVSSHFANNKLGAHEACVMQFQRCRIPQTDVASAG